MVDVGVQVHPALGEKCALEVKFRAVGRSRASGSNGLEDSVWATSTSVGSWEKAAFCRGRTLRISNGSAIGVFFPQVLFRPALEMVLTVSTPAAGPRHPLGVDPGDAVVVVAGMTRSQAVGCAGFGWIVGKQVLLFLKAAHHNFGIVRFHVAGINLEEAEINVVIPDHDGGFPIPESLAQLADVQAAHRRIDGHIAPTTLSLPAFSARPIPLDWCK